MSPIPSSPSSAIEGEGDDDVVDGEISNEIGQLFVTPSPQTEEGGGMSRMSPSKENENNNDDGPTTSTITTTEPATTTVTTTTTTTTTSLNSKDEQAEAAAAAEAQRRRAEWPLTGITEPGMNDCLFGRGGGTNHHPGNKRYRKLVEEKKDKYLSSKRLDKPLVAMEIINEWRNLDPPGRFLKQDEITKLWNDVGEKKAREKTSQALREKTPVKQREGYGGGGGEGHDGSAEGGGGEYYYDLGVGDHHRTTRFQPGTTSPPSSRYVRRSQLARDHSLGTEIMGANEISLEGFSWEDDTEPVIGSNSNNNSDNDDAQHVASTNGHPPHGERYYYPQYYGGGGGGGHPDYYRDPKQPPPPLQPPYSQHHHVREHSLSTNPLPNTNVSRPAHPTFGDPPSLGYGQNNNYPPNYGPPPSHHHHHHHHHAQYPPPPPHHQYPSFPPPPPPPPQMKQQELRTREHNVPSNVRHGTTPS